VSSNIRKVRRFPNLEQEIGGWPYRALALNPDGAVLEVGDALARHWFDNVVRSDLIDTRDAARPDGRFDLVLLHYALGGHRALAGAARAAHSVLRDGGQLMVAGENLLRHSRRRDPSIAPAPRATGWGYRMALSSAGFSGVALFAMHPEGNAPIYLIDARRHSTMNFYGASPAAQPRSRWSPTRALLSLLAHANLIPHLQPGFLVIGTKC
jgi:hypothetical protein